MRKHRSRTNPGLTDLEIAALRMIHRHDAGFGRIRFAQVLAGRPTAGVQEHGLDQDPAFGSAPDLTSALAALDALLGRRMLRVANEARNRPVLALTDEAGALAAVTTGNPRHPPPARLDPVQREQLRRLLEWRDLIALEEECPAHALASKSTLRRLVREAPTTREQLAASELLPAGAPKRFRRIVLEVIRGVDANPAG